MSYTQYEEYDEKKNRKRKFPKPRHTAFLDERDNKAGRFFQRKKRKVINKDWVEGSLGNDGNI